MLFCFVLAFAVASPRIITAQIHRSKDTLQTPEENEENINVRWPFCPSYPDNFCKELHWVDMTISMDGYSQHRNAPHDSFQEIITTSIDDMQPLAQALKTYYSSKSITSTAQQVGIVQGMIQSIHYAYDSCEGEGAKCSEKDTTGWTEYPKYAIEFFVDQKGDCDDATIASVAILEALQIESWLVLWSGHISTALTREQGDLSSVTIPKGSKFILPPDGSAKKLHVDSVGVVDGCKWDKGYACHPLGYNEWEKRNAKLEKVIRYSDPGVDALGIIARKQNIAYFEVKREDRRKDSRDKIRQEIEQQKQNWEEENTKRLEDLGKDREKAKEVLQKVNPYQGNSNEGWALIIGLCLAAFGGLVFSLFKQRKRLRKAADKAKREREMESF
jgi:hypothetical protein